MTKKEARQECRNLAIEHGRSMWPLCFHKRFGYYAADNFDGNGFHICWVARNGQFMYATKENEKRHNLKGNIPYIGPQTGRRR